jgi:hypothetical protein
MSDFDARPPTQITMSRIPIRGGIGAFVLIVILVAGVLADLPQLRWIYLGAVAFGLLFALALILWRRRTMDTHTLPPGARTMFAPEPAASERATRAVDERRKERPFTRPGAHPRVAPAS